MARLLKPIDLRHMPHESKYSSDRIYHPTACEHEEGEWIELCSGTTFDTADERNGNGRRYGANPKDSQPPRLLYVVYHLHFIKHEDEREEDDEHR